MADSFWGNSKSTKRSKDKNSQNLLPPNKSVLQYLIGILGQVWYLIVSIPDLCTLAYSFKENADQEVNVSEKSGICTQSKQF